MIRRATLLACLLALGEAAAVAPKPASGAPQGVTVPAWNELTEEQRKDLAQFAPAWDRLPAFRRMMILEQHQRWSRLPPEKRKALRHGEREFHRMTPARKEKMRLSMATVRGLPEEEQRRLRRLWQSLSPRERGEWLDRGGPGIAPPPR